MAAAVQVGWVSSRADDLGLQRALQGAISRLSTLTSVEFVARRLGVKPATVERWLRRGVPLSRARDEETLSAVYRDLASWDEDSSKRAQRQARLVAARERAAETKAGEEAATAVAAELETLACRFEALQPKEASGRRITPLMHLADELEVSRATLKAQVSRGKLSGAVLSAWTKMQRAAQQYDAAVYPLKREIKRLVALARKPGKQIGAVTDRNGRQVVGVVDAPKPYRVRPKEAAIASVARAGWAWSCSIREFLTEDTIAQMVAFARCVKLPWFRRQAAKRYNRWLIVALTAEYTPEKALPGTKGLKGISKSDKAVIRQFGISVATGSRGEKVRADGGGTHADNVVGKSLSIQQPRSGGSHSSRDGAIDSFVLRMRDLIEAGRINLVEGVIVEHWRDRSESEQLDVMSERHAKVMAAQKRRRERKKRQAQPTDRPRIGKGRARKLTTKSAKKSTKKTRKKGTNVK